MCAVHFVFNAFRSLKSTIYVTYDGDDEDENSGGAYFLFPKNVFIVFCVVCVCACVKVNIFFVLPPLTKKVFPCVTV